MNFSKIKKDLNIKFTSQSLLMRSFTHKSASKDNNNEKLEFLGDRVIGLTLSTKLFELYPNENEGVLDKRFSSLVNRKTCCNISWSIGLQRYIILGNKIKVSRKDEKLLSDSIEALIGAIYLDQGYDYTKNFILRIWKNELKKSNITVLDSKTQLQEYSLKINKKLPTYNIISFSGPKHKPIYKISVNINKSNKFIGSGNSKQEAQQNAAFKLLKNLNLI
tara:strand:- start:1109 stop:1768 length:660 start_codon:yes stop_codon:yes gene_type:complete